MRSSPFCCCSSPSSPSLRPATAAADDEQFAETRAQIAGARTLVDQAVDAARAGDRERGYDLAREAYLDHFELAEVPLRLRDPNLVLDLEFTFAELRNGIRDGAPVVASSRSWSDAIHLGLRKVDRALADKGFAAPLLAFGFSFTILFREGVEAVLLIAILLGSLEAGRASDYRRPLGLGVLGAVVATRDHVGAGDARARHRAGRSASCSRRAPRWSRSRCSSWSASGSSRGSSSGDWMEFMRARVAAAIAAGSALAFAGLGFTAVYREGFETVLFYQALALFAEGLGSGCSLGVAAAALALAAVGYAILKLGKRLPLKPLLIGGASMLLLLSVAFAGNAVRSLQEADWIAGHADRGRLGAAPDLPRRADRHPPDARGHRACRLVLLAVYVGGRDVGVPLCQPLRDAGPRRPRARERRAPHRRRRRRHVHEGRRGRAPPPRAASRTRPSRPPTTPRTGVAEGVAAALRAASRRARRRPRTASSSSPSRRRRR